MRGASSGSYYPVFEWEEEDYLPTQDACERKIVATNQLSYSHGATRIPGKEGILPDTGAVHNLSGLSFVQRQGQLAAAYGHSVKWQQLNKPKQVAGVGDAAKPCTHQAVVPGRLRSGSRIHYAAPIIGGGPSDIPALYGLDSMASENTFFGTRGGLMARVPDGLEDSIVWPTGTRFDQCERAPSGHWLLIISHFDEPPTYVNVPLQPPTTAGAPTTNNNADLTTIEQCAAARRDMTHDECIAAGYDPDLAEHLHAEFMPGHEE